MDLDLAYKKMKERHRLRIFNSIKLQIKENYIKTYSKLDYNQKRLKYEYWAGFISAMALQYEFSYKQLNEIADYLIDIFYIKKKTFFTKKEYLTLR